MKKFVFILLINLILLLSLQPSAMAENKDTWILSNQLRGTCAKLQDLIFKQFRFLRNVSIPGSYYSNYSNQKTIFVYLIGDGLTEEQAEIIWGKKVEDIDKTTLEQGVIADYKVLNENDALLLSAIDLDTLTNAIINDTNIRNLIEKILKAENVIPQNQLEIPHIKLKIYSPSRNVYNEIISNLGIGVGGGGSKPYGYQNDKGIIVHLVGDDLEDTQTEMIWGRKLKDLDKETNEKGILFSLSRLNENPVLLLAAKNLNTLSNEIKNNLELKNAIIQIKRAKEVTPSKLIDIPAPGEKIIKNNHNEHLTMNNEIILVADGEKLKLDAPPQVIKGRVLVPLRGIFEKFGVEVVWDSKTQTIKAKRAKENIQLIIGENTSFINGVEKNLDVSAQVNYGRTYVPLRFISESIGLKINWDKKSQKVEILSR